MHQIHFGRGLEGGTFVTRTSDMCEKDSLRGGGLGSRPKKNVRGEIGEWGRVPFNEPYAPSLSTIYDGA